MITVADAKQNTTNKKQDKKTKQHVYGTIRGTTDKAPVLVESV